jgi:PAS domain S-box-containing protein
MTINNTKDIVIEFDNAVLSQIEDRGLAGLWQWDIGTDRFEGSPGVGRILGLDPGRLQGMGALENLVHPDDRIDTSDPYRNAREGRYDYRAMRIIRPNGEMRWISLRSGVQYDRNGEPKSLMGILIDESDHAFRRKSTQVAELRSAADRAGKPQGQGHWMVIADPRKGALARVDQMVRSHFGWQAIRPHAPTRYN